jgi:pimeloyl-ACP methyl ester carboxylesterase
MTNPLLTHALVTPNAAPDAGTPPGTPAGTASVTPAGAPPRLKWVLFLHGILGSGGNWRSFARKLVTERPGWGAVLVDLRNHGGSQGFAPPHTVAACADDLQALALTLPGPVRGVVGHSFGGKVALAFAEARRDDLETAVIVDSTPSSRPGMRGSELTARVMGVLRALPPVLPSREAFFEIMRREQISEPTAQWLAMNVRAVDGGFRFRLDLAAVDAMLDDYFLQDLWAPIEAPGSRPRVHVVVGAKSEVLSPEDRARAAAAAAQHPERVFVHTIEEAGHWVHVDAPEPMQRILLEAFP